jgi:hypothetical protein
VALVEQVTQEQQELQAEAEQDRLKIQVSPQQLVQQIGVVQVEVLSVEAVAEQVAQE